MPVYELLNTVDDPSDLIAGLLPGLLEPCRVLEPQYSRVPLSCRSQAPLGARMFRTVHHDYTGWYTLQRLSQPLRFG